MKEGFLIGGGLLLAGVLLQAVAGPVPWDRMAHPVNLLSVPGLLIYAAYIVGLWISLERPPLRTQGETRLWYSFFLALIGILMYSRWRYKWILSFSTVLALVFICVNLFKPEIHNKTLMPALMSPWFVPHVIVYMLSSAILGAATLMGIYLLSFRRGAISEREMVQTDDLVYVGQAFLTFGMLFGSLWAHAAWGTYWGWDPKETWAAITWLCYLLYILFRRARPRTDRAALWLLLAAFLCLQMCWWGITFLPSARATSIHVY
mgnify:CR=1 FL=1